MCGAEEKSKPREDQSISAQACHAGEFLSPEVFMHKQAGYLSRILWVIPALEIWIP